MTDPLVSAALEAHARGWTPTPLLPASKRPLMQDWPSTHYEGPEDVTTAFDSALAAEGRYAGQTFNLGLALGPSHGGLVDIDLDHYKALGLAQKLLPDTAMRSGHPSNPGSHYWYQIDGYDPGLAALKLPDGKVIVEWRGAGGQTVVPPSVHPDGETYEWYGEALGGAAGPTHLDEAGARGLHSLILIIAMTVTLADAWPRTGGRHSAYLPLVGGLLRDADDEGRPRLHPLWNENIENIIHIIVGLTNDADGARARINEAVESTRRKIVRGDKVQGWPTLGGIIGDEHLRKVLEWVEQVESLNGAPRAKRKRTDEEWYDEHATALRVVDPDKDGTGETPLERDVRLALLEPSERDPLAERLSEWERVDLGPYLKGGIEPPTPGLLLRSDGVGLLYPGRVNSLYGEGGSGKTLLALDIASRLMIERQNVMLIDMEDEPHGTLDRLDSLGLDHDVIEQRLAYIRPEYQPLSAMQVDRWGNYSMTDVGRRSAAALDAALDAHAPTLIIIDGTTTLYGIHGQDTNAANGTDVIARWLRRLTHNGRRTVLLIDHTSKVASPASTPIGSQHKIGMIQGVALHVFAVNKPRRGQRVEAALYVGKDRPGVVAEHSIEGQALQAATVVFDATGSRLQISLDPPNGGKAIVSPSQSRVANEEQSILDALESHYPQTLSRAEVLLIAGLSAMTDRVWANRRDSLLNKNLMTNVGGSTKSARYQWVPSQNGD